MHAKLLYSICYKPSMHTNISTNIIRILLSGILLGANFVAPVMAGWEMQWIDRFDGTEVDWNNWIAQVQANFNAEVQCYTDDDSSVDKNYDVSNGTLKIIARRQSINCPGLGGAPRTWTSGRINSKDKVEFQYGRIESRIRFLNLQGGTWPAFWMLENRIFEHPIANDNDFVNWPNPGAGEIDVWEWFSNNPGSYITNFFNTGGCGSETRYNYPGGGPDVQQWHRYAIEWDQNAITFYIDDIAVDSHDVSTCLQYKEPMFVLLNVAMGGTLGGSIDPSLNTATMEVDYVAHCTATSSNSASYCGETTLAPGGDLVIFDDSERVDWAAWDCCGGSTPTQLVDNNALYADVMEFSINGNTVVGFTTRAPDAINGTAYDASGIVNNGMLEFDLKMTASPGSTDWKLKLESGGGATSTEVSLSTSIESHVSPQLDTWQHYSFSLSDLAALGLDLSAVDLVTVFPEWGTGNGAVFRIDNVKILENASQSAPVITSIPGTSISTDMTYSYEFVATDADGDTLTMTASAIPTWLSFDSTSGVLSGTPAAADIGSHSVSLAVSDGTVTTRQTFFISVTANSAPFFTSTAERAARVGVVYEYSLSASDADGDNLILSSISIPGWLSFNRVAGLLSGEPTNADIGTHDVSFTVSDGRNSVTQAFTIKVTGAQDSDDTEDSSGSSASVTMLLIFLLLSSLACKRSTRRQ